MNDDNSNAYIRKTISLAAYEIKSRLEKRDTAAARLRSLFEDLGFDLTSIREQATSLIKVLVRTSMTAEALLNLTENESLSSRMSLQMNAVAGSADPGFLPVTFWFWRLIEDALFPLIVFTL